MKNGDENGLSDEEPTFEVVFRHDDDVLEHIYIEGGKQQEKAIKKKLALAPDNYATPTHKRVHDLRETPPSKHSARSSPRLASRPRNHLYVGEMEVIEESDEEEEPHRPLKPMALFPEDSADELNQNSVPLFSPRHRKGQMLKKATDCANKNSPSGSHTPSSNCSTPTSKSMTPRSSKRIIEARTPHTQRQNIRKNLASFMEEESNSDWSESSNDSESSSEDSDDSILPTPKMQEITPRGRGRPPSNQQETTPKRAPPSPSQQDNTPKSGRKTTSESAAPSMTTRTRSQAVKNTYTPDDYFTSQASSKVVTSDHTLKRLQNPRLGHEAMQDVLKRILPKHKQEVERLLGIYGERFGRWMSLLSEGFNLILHGLGSKASILNDFYGKMLADDCDVVVINGFFATLTLKDILRTIAEEVLGLTSVPCDDIECCDLIVASYLDEDAEPLYLLLNNLDGPLLQGERTQAVLARLAAVPSIRLVATIDHVNAPLLFDQSLLVKFNFVWQTVSTFLPYTEETSFENSLMVQQSGGLALASLRSVFQSLTSNARGIFMILLNKQMDSEDPKYPGMLFRDLYRESRDGFLVSSDLALRSQLTEFLDHQLVRSKRSNDGECLFIPIPRSTLKEFTTMQEE